MRRLRAIAPLAAAVALLPVLALAAPPTAKPPSPSASFVASGAHDGGVIDGTVTAVDYQRGTVTVATAHGPVGISLMPSTSVNSTDPGYHGISDVAKGAKVQVFTSRIAGRLVAQMIRLVKR